MLRYWHDPDRPNEPIVEAEPRVVNSYRAFVRAYLNRRFRDLGSGDVEDVAQNTVIAACDMVAEQRMRGAYTRTPDDVLRGVLVQIAWFVAMNAIREQRIRERVMHTGIFDALTQSAPAPASSPEELAEARRTLSALAEAARTRPALHTVILHAEGDTVRDLARLLGITDGGVSIRVIREQRALAREHDRPPRKKRRRDKREP